MRKELEEYIAEVAALLASYRAKFITGANYRVDGGMTVADERALPTWISKSIVFSTYCEQRKFWDVARHQTPHLRALPERVTFHFVLSSRACEPPGRVLRSHHPRVEVRLTRYEEVRI